MSLVNAPKMTINPISHPLAARVEVPGSKSITNRALLISALAEGTSTLHNALFSDDSHYFAEAIKKLGFEISLDPSAKTMRVTGLGGHIPNNHADLLIGNAGTAARFLTAMLTLGHGEFSIEGVKRMRQRPIAQLVTALNRLGARVETISGCPPVHIRADGLPGGVTSIRGDVSSQYLSGLLMVAPYAQKPVEINVEGPLNSKPYIDLTLGVMADFGVSVQRDGYAQFLVTPQQYRAVDDYYVESDASGASYFFAAPAICGGWVEVASLSRDARQGDIAFLDILADMGCAVTEKGNLVRVSGPERLRGVNVDMSSISDTSMTLSAIAPFANSPTTISGITSSRLKETDRVTATCTELRRLGVQVDEHSDGLTIYPASRFRAASIHTYDDHRIAMAFSLIGLSIPGIEIEDPACVSKTFPNFFEVLGQLG